MATSTTPQPYTADRPENSTTSVDANRDLHDFGYAARIKAFEPRPRLDLIERAQIFRPQLQDAYRHITCSCGGTLTIS